MLARSPWLLAALALVGCRVGEVDLDGLECPCAEGWVCVDEVCQRRDALPDAATPPDLGSPEDAGVDQGVEDLGIDQGMDLGSDAGPPDLGPEEDAGSLEPVDCSPLMGRENTEFCAATRETCSAEAQNMTTCDDLCAAVGLVCLEAYDDLMPECGPDLANPTTCDDAMKVAYHCLCVRE